MEFSLKSGRKAREMLRTSVLLDSFEFSRVLVCFFLLFHFPSVGSIEIGFIGADEVKLVSEPKYLKICHRSDPNIDDCVKSSLEKLMKSVNSDSSENVLPSIDPIKIPLLEIQEGSGNVSLNMVFKDLEIHGFNKFEIKGVKTDLTDNKFEISMRTPYIDTNAILSVEGGVFTLPISGQGDFSLNLTDVSAVLILHFGLTKDLAGFTYLKVEKSIMTLLPSDIHASFGDYIDGSNEIGSAFNSFFNYNAQEIFEMIKPQVSEIFGKVAKAIANEILSRHPEKTLLPD